MLNLFKINKVNNHLLKIMVFLIPLFFLSTTPYQLGMDNYSKYLLFSVFFVAIILFYGVRILRGLPLKYRLSKQEWLLFLLVFVVFLASVFGVNSFVSLYGNLENTVLPFGVIVLMVLFYLYLVAIDHDFNESLGVLKALMVSLALLSTMSFFVVYFFGASSWSVYYRLLAGSQEDLSLIMVLFIFAMLLLASFKDLKEAFMPSLVSRTLYAIALSLAILTIVKTNFYWAFVVLLVFSILVLALRHRINRDDYVNQRSGLANIKKYLLPLLLVLLSLNYILNFYLVYGPSVLDDKLRQYRQLNWSQSYDLTTQTLKDKPILGIGPENFDYAFSKYRSKEFNNNLHWDLRYNKAGSFFLETVVATGIMGLLLLVVFGFLVFANFYSALKNFRNSKLEQYELLRTCLLVFLVTSFIVYSSNSLFIFIFFLLLGLGIKKDGLRELNINEKNKIGYYLLYGMVLVFSILYLSSITKHAIADSGAGFIKKDEEKIVKSVSLSPKRYQFNLEAAELYLEKAVESVSLGDLELASQYQKQASVYIARASKLAIHSVKAQEKIAMFFRSLPGFNEQNRIMVLEAFTRAHNLEPSNPVILTEMGKANLDLGETDEAIKNFEEAKMLKNDYLPVDLGIARAYSRTDRVDEALEILNNVKEVIQDVSVYYEIGLVYFNQENYTRAQEAFSKAVAISPLHSNSLYGLGLTLEKLGEEDQALFYYKKIQRLNPSNLEIAEKIKTLSSD